MTEKKIRRMGRKVRTDPTPPITPFRISPLTQSGAPVSDGSIHRAK